jgi:hypothetical protein
VRDRSAQQEGILMAMIECFFERIKIEHEDCGQPNVYNNQKILSIVCCLGKLEGEW